MFIKIYFNDKPLFLCDSIEGDLENYVHHDDAVLIDEFSPHAIHAMIHEMQQEKVHAGVFVYKDLAALQKAFWKKFTVIQAAGGLVRDREGAVLFMFRRGKWDLPKGKLDPGESLAECAVREVEEETGLKNIRQGKLLITTYHTYHEAGRFYLKENYWYEMKVNSHQALVPQTEEDIQEVRWVRKESMQDLLTNTFPSIIDVLKAGGLGG